MENQALIKEIKALKAQKEALIVAHYYVDDSVQAIADYVGDSYYLSKVCMEHSEKLIIFCGVKFMGESAKILNPEKTIIMPDDLADCPMAHMTNVDKIKKVREQYEDVAVVCYINSSADIKAHSDVIVTSSNAYDIVSKLKQKNIFFIPDQHLAHFIAEKLPNKHFIFNDGFCHVHTSVEEEQLKQVMKEHPKAKVLVHPECPSNIVAHSDYAGSTAGILNYATMSDAKEFIIVTELGILYELRKKNPGKQFYTINNEQICPNMKRINLENLHQALANAKEEVIVEENIARKAKAALLRMHELGN